LFGPVTKAVCSADIRSGLFKGLLNKPELTALKSTFLNKSEAAVAKQDLEQFIKANGAPAGGGGGLDYGNK
jgi:hypothetical protein